LGALLQHGVVMKLSSRVCLISALTVTVLGDFSAVPVAGQGGAVFDPLGTPAAEAPLARFDDKDTPVPAKPRDLESVLGREIRTRVEEDVGRIIDLLADHNGHVQAAVIEFGGFMGIGTRKIAVEWSTLRFEREGKQPVVTLEMTRDQLRRAPEYKSLEPAVVRKADE
jgi:PRC-barrel domain